MNCHDFTTPIKTRLVEKLAEILPGDLNGFQFYDSGTAAVEAGSACCGRPRASTR
jgi:adenosylmethionine-8-amino-7-oxononanoate aminotransferase